MRAIGVPQRYVLGALLFLWADVLSAGQPPAVMMYSSIGVSSSCAHVNQTLT